MADILPGYFKIEYTGPGVTIANEAWAPYIDFLIDVRADRQGLSSYRKGSTIQSLAGLATNQLYLGRANTAFTLPNASLTHQGGTVSPPANTVPLANAGSDLAITAPATQVVLQGSGSDAEGPVTVGWTQVEGPNNATGLPSSSASTIAGGLIVGIYKFRFGATDSAGVTTYDETILTVNAAVNTPVYAQIGFGGDSMMSEQLPPSPRELLQSKMDGNIFKGWQNYAEAGNTIPQMRYNQPPKFVIDPNASQYIFVINGGTNCFGQYYQTANGNVVPTAQMVANEILGFSNDLRARVTNGKRVSVVYMTPPDCQNYPNALITVSEMRTRREALIALLLANPAAYGINVVANTFSDPNLGPAGAADNRTYFNADKLHPEGEGKIHECETLEPAILRAYNNLPGVQNYPGAVTAPAPTYTPPASVVGWFESDTESIGIRKNKISGGMDWGKYGGEPTLTVNGLNNLPVASWDNKFGVHDNNRIYLQSYRPAGTNDQTFIILARHKGDGSQNYDNSFFNLAGMGQFYVNSATSPKARLFATSGPSYDPGVNNWFVVTCRFQSPGVSFLTGVNRTALPGTGTLGQLDNNTPILGENFVGDVAAVLIANSLLSPAEEQAYLGYLKSKWNAPD